MPSNWTRLNGGKVAAIFRGRRYVGDTTDEVLTAIRSALRAEVARETSRREEKRAAHGQY